VIFIALPKQLHYEKKNGFPASSKKRKKVRLLAKKVYRIRAAAGIGSACFT
jgi:hypothetical protein